jgi:hypothetical protein
MAFNSAQLNPPLRDRGIKLSRLGRSRLVRAATNHRGESVIQFTCVRPKTR